MEGTPIAGDIHYHQRIGRELLCHGVPRRRYYVVRHGGAGRIYLEYIYFFHSNNLLMDIHGNQTAHMHTILYKIIIINPSTSTSMRALFISIFELSSLFMIIPDVPAPCRQHTHLILSHCLANHARLTISRIHTHPHGSLNTPNTTPNSSSLYIISTQSHKIAPAPSSTTIIVPSSHTYRHA